MQNRVLKISWFGCGALVGLMSLSLALGSVPRKGTVTDDTAIYQNLSEIKVSKEKLPSFDSDLGRLALAEGHYHEKLPSLADHPRLKAPVKRVSRQKYRR